MCVGAEIAGVVKADAYGCGLQRVARVLVETGCRTFFVAHLHEGIALRRHEPGIEIYALHGMLPGTGPLYAAHNIKPILTSLSQIKEWGDFIQSSSATNLAAGIHVCTGMNRSGISIDQISATRELVDRHPTLFDLIMSHFSCADQINQPRNKQQLDAFSSIRSEFQGLRASIANTGGCFLGRNAHFDIVRPGIGIYGGNPFEIGANPFRSAITLKAPIIELRQCRVGDYVGYGSDFRLDHDCTVALLSIGYADGLPRNVSSAGSHGLSFFYKDSRLPLLGRISMDLTIVEVPQDLDRKIRVRDQVEVFGAHQTIDEFAKLLGTIPNEVLTSFKERVDREYKISNQIESEDFSNEGSSLR
jgi:alanine racemase